MIMRMIYQQTGNALQDGLCSQGAVGQNGWQAASDQLEGSETSSPPTLFPHHRSATDGFFTPQKAPEVHYANLARNSTSSSWRGPKPHHYHNCAVFWTAAANGLISHRLIFVAPLKNCWKFKPVKVTQTTLMGENIFEILDLSAPRFESRQSSREGHFQSLFGRAWCGSWILPAQC